MNRLIVSRARIGFLATVDFFFAAGFYDLDSWPTIHGDARNSDTVQAPGFTFLEVKWSRDFPGYVAAAAKIDSGGQVYVTTTATISH